MAPVSRIAATGFVAAASAAAAVPEAVPTQAPSAHADGFPGWPTTWEGRALTPLPLTTRESFLARGFPGRIGRFSDGDSEIVLRWVRGATRRLHPAADCFRGIGWRVASAPMRVAGDGRRMSCITAAGPDGRRLDVCEQIRRAGAGTDPMDFPDVSSWYWHALWRGSGEAWWSAVVATPM